MGKTDWIVVNFKNSPVVFECRHCGQTAPFPSNCSIRYAADVSKVFAKHHRHCKPRSEVPKDGKK